MTRFAIRGVAVFLLLSVSGCQYFTYYKTNSTFAPSQQQTSAKTVCEAMGANSGNAALDWCVAQEEADRRRYTRY